MISTLVLVLLFSTLSNEQFIDSNNVLDNGKQSIVRPEGQPVLLSQESIFLLYTNITGQFDQQVSYLQEHDLGKDTICTSLYVLNDFNYSQSISVQSKSDHHHSWIQNKFI